MNQKTKIENYQEDKINDLTKAIELDEKGQYGSIEDYTRAIELAPDFALGYQRRWKAYCQQAQADIRRLLELTTDSAQREKIREKSYEFNCYLHLPSPTTTADDGDIVVDILQSEAVIHLEPSAPLLKVGEVMTVEVLLDNVTDLSGADICVTK